MSTNLYLTTNIMFMCFIWKLRLAIVPAISPMKLMVEKPAVVSSFLHCSSVLSMPPSEWTIINMSNIWGSPPLGCSTQSWISTFPFSGSTFWQLFKILRQFSSFQSCIIRYKSTQYKQPSQHPQLKMLGANTL